MPEADWKKLQSIFDHAVELSEPERTTYLDEACSGQPELRAEVESLLSADQKETLHPNVPPLDEMRLDPDPEQVGPYRIIQRIGTGGMGAVYLAERSDGTFERQVALKVVKRGMDSESVVRRFNQERHILARLSHANIAALLDGGVTEGGRPYFVMEYVDGLPITEYCRANQLDLNARLALFRKVCDAVHAAHQGLVVHRDLKPSNIMVTRDGEVKLLDFGIAKLLDDTDEPQITRTGMLALTPAYAAPEQVLSQAISTVTDVYGLGVILYELLAGRRPFEITKTPEEIRDEIVNREPTRPSSTDTRVDSDLDTICLKALRKQPGERYASAAQLSEDIGRHLSGQPVLARDSTVWYRAGKFVRRHRVGVAATVLVILGFIVLTSFYTQRLAQERDAALAEQARVTEVVDFVTGLFAISDPNESRGADISAHDLLEEGRLQIRTELSGQPDLQATMKRVLAEVYLMLDDVDPAMELANESWEYRQIAGEANSLEAASSLSVMGRLYQARGDYEQADEMLRQTLAIRQSLLPPDHIEIMGSISDLAFLAETRTHFDEAAELHRQALQMARALYPGDDEIVADQMSDLAGFYRTQDQQELAEPLLRDGIAMLDRLYDGEHPLSAKMKRQLAGLLRNTNRTEEAEPLYQDIIAQQERMLGPYHHELAVTLNGYSQLLSNTGRYEEAMEANRRMLDILEHAYDGPHPSLGAAYNNLAFMLMDLERLEEALEYFELSLDMQDAVDLPKRHLNRSFPTSGIAGIYYTWERYDECEAIHRDMLSIRLEALPDEHRLVSESRRDLAACLIQLERYDEAEPLLLTALANLQKDRANDDVRIQSTAWHLIELYHGMGEAERAAPYEAIYTGDNRIE